MRSLRRIVALGGVAPLLVGLVGCAGDPRADRCDDTGAVVAEAADFDTVRVRAVRALAPGGTSTVVRGERRGVVVDVEDADGEPVDQVIAIYVDPSDSWRARRYLGCPS